MMSGQFCQTNLLLSDMQNNNGLLAKPFKNSQNHPYGQPVLTFDKRKFHCEALRAMACLNEH